MAITFNQYLQSLLQSVTTYYTVSYSNDTELYNILQMYSSELTSGSIALETVRNNLFVVKCENLKLYDNFGTYFGQGKYSDQTYDDDRYISGSGTFKITTSALRVSQVVESSDAWEIASHTSPLTNFPSNWGSLRPLGDTVVFDDNFVSSCFIQADFPQYYDIVRYSPVENEWGIEHTAQWNWAGEGYDTPLMGLITYRPYLGQGQYDQEYMYYLYFSFAYGLILPPPLGGPQPVSPTFPRVQVVRKTPGTLTESGWSGISSDPVLFSAGGGTYHLDPLKNQEQTWTDSVVFHDKLYFGVCISMWDTSDTDTYTNGTPMWAPDDTYKYPFLIECDPITMDIRETGLAMYISNAVGNNDFQLHAMTKHNNKLWIDASQDSIEFTFSGSVNNSVANTANRINDFVSSGSGIFAATGLNSKLLYSTDDGNTWDEIAQLQYMDPVVTFPDHLFSCEISGSYLYVGTDHKLIFRGPIQYITAPGFYASGSSDIEEPTYNRVYHGAAGIIENFKAFGGRMYACAFSNEIFRSDVDGLNWSRVLAYEHAGGIRTLEVSGSTLIGGSGTLTGPQITKSTNGTTWSSGSSAAELDPTYSLKTFEGTSGVHIYAGTGSNSNLYRSITAVSGSWELVAANLGAVPAAADSGDIISLEVFDSALYVGLKDTSNTPAEDGVLIYRSTSGDNGSFGSPVFQAVGGGNLTPEVLFAQGSYIYVGLGSDSGGEIWRSATGASGSWTQVANVWNSVKSFAYINEYIYASLEGGEIYKSVSGSAGTWEFYIKVPSTINPYPQTTYALGTSGSSMYIGVNYSICTDVWEEVASGSLVPWNVADLYKFNNALFAAVNQGGLHHVYRTINGTTWTQVNAAPAEVVNKGGNELKEFNGYLYAVGVGENITIRSSDGITWENAIDGLGTAGTSVGYYLETHNNYLYSTNASWHLVRTSNGTTWDIRYTGFSAQINSILSYQNTLYVGLDSGELWSSTDDGKTFILFQTPSAWHVAKLDTHNDYAFCGTFDVPKGKIFKWGSRSNHYMTTYDGTNFTSETSPATAGDVILKMHSYRGQLYAIINSIGGYIVRRYDGSSWSTHSSFSYAINTMYEYEGLLLISTVNGDVFYLDTTNDVWTQYLVIPDLIFSTKGVTAFAKYTMSPTKVYSFVDNAWYSSEFISSDIIHYAISGAGVSGSTTQWAAIPGYRKQLDFMLDAAMHGGTHQGIIKVSNAFTLINPDIREAYIT
ncbi:hypothetical protein LCGC14_1353360, partial [marine sediment metagenome]